MEVLIEAVPWPCEPAAENGPAQHKRRRSFAARSGIQPIRVIATLVAAFEGPCPRLGDDMRCTAYEERPRVCRIYPAEVNPFMMLAPSNKACPPEAWKVEHPILERAGRIVNSDTVELVRQSRDADAQDVPIKERFVVMLGYDATALSNEGFVRYAPQPATALAALEAVVSTCSSPPADDAASEWTFVSDQTDTVETLVSIDAKAQRALDVEGQGFRYLRLRAENTHR